MKRSSLNIIKQDIEELKSGNLDFFDANLSKLQIVWFQKRYKDIEIEKIGLLYFFPINIFACRVRLKD